ncbi:MAG: glutamine-hydrolyzing carbamoyl-phosphate synthase small subunit [Bacteroidetes bacterium]|nr:glutamine-hydrolyzing carbamoyl-phosphate synthase small subunit [Bacteroidota bacterium]
MSSNPVSALLVLQDGTVFKGTAIGKIGTTTGEIAFNTGMTGYQEVFTDPSYFGQILIMTNDHIGNYGVHADEIESDDIKISGLVCKKFSHNFSRKLNAFSLDEYFTQNHLVGISDVDTRQLVRHIRQAGAMNAVISSEISNVDELLKIVSACPDMTGLELASKVSSANFHTMGNADAPRKVALLDFGNKLNIARCLAERNCLVGIFPAKTTAEEVLKWKPDGIMLSNGPGDPAAMDYAIETVKTLVNMGIPTFGICLGHQLLSLASGLKTYKMHHGHRGLNHPVKNLVSGRSEITSQNHGFAVEFNNDLKDTVELTHINLNDDSVEGIRRLDKPAFSVQHHPEASPGPHDSLYLFDQFVELIESHRNTMAAAN